MIIDFSKVQKIKIGSHQINNQININAIKAFEKILIKSKEYNLDFIVTGGMGSLLYYNKIYRDLKDVDILIDTNSIDQWMTILKDEYDYCHNYSSFNPNPMGRLFDFLKREANSIVLFDKTYDIKIELIQVPLKNEYFFHVKKDEYDIKIKNPFFIYIKKQEFKRKKDFEDWNFYQQYLSA